MKISGRKGFIIKFCEFFFVGKGKRQEKQMKPLIKIARLKSTEGIRNLLFGQAVPEEFYFFLLLNNQKRTSAS